MMGWSNKGAKGWLSGQGDLTGLIRKKAQELYEKSGRKEGRDLENWLEAERLVRQKSNEGGFGGT